MSHRALLHIVLLRECEPRAVAAGLLLAIAGAVLFAGLAPAPDDPLQRAVVRLLGSFEAFAASVATAAAMILGIERTVADRTDAWLSALEARRRSATAYPVVLAAAIGCAAITVWLVALAAFAVVAGSLPAPSPTIVGVTWVRAFAGALFGILLALVARSRGLTQAILVVWAFGPFVVVFGQVYASQSPALPGLMRIVTFASPGALLLLEARDVAGAVLRALLLSAAGVVLGPRLGRVS